MNVDDVYRWTVLLAGVGVTIKALETMFLMPAYARRGILDYDVTGSDFLLVSRLSSALARMYSGRGVLVLSVLTVVSFAAVLAFEFGSAGYRWALLVLIVANVALYYRQAFGLDGADQMSFLVLLTVLLCWLLAPDEGVHRIGIWFIALQLALSYFVSGAAKLVSTEWRSGTAIPGILSTYTYGTRLTRRLFVRHRRLSLAVCWAVIVVELILPFGLVLGEQGALTLLAVGLGMHVSIAMIMGLNDFVWGFTAAYPAFYYLASTA